MNILPYDVVRTGRLVLEPIVNPDMTNQESFLSRYIPGRSGANTYYARHSFEFVHRNRKVKNTLVEFTIKYNTIDKLYPKSKIIWGKAHYQTRRGWGTVWSEKIKIEDIYHMFIIDIENGIKYQVYPYQYDLHYLAHKLLAKKEIILPYLMKYHDSNYNCTGPSRWNHVNYINVIFDDEIRIVDNDRWDSFNYPTPGYYGYINRDVPMWNYKGVLIDDRKDKKRHNELLVNVL